MDSFKLIYRTISACYVRSSISLISHVFLRHFYFPQKQAVHFLFIFILLTFKHFHKTAAKSEWERWISCDDQTTPILRERNVTINIIDRAWMYWAVHWFRTFLLIYFKVFMFFISIFDIFFLFRKHFFYTNHIRMHELVFL